MPERTAARSAAAANSRARALRARARDTLVHAGGARVHEDISRIWALIFPPKLRFRARI